MEAPHQTATCRNCRQAFAIQESDQNYYQKLDVPRPTLCPDCRQQRRSAAINQLHLFRRTCAATGKSLICNQPPESTFKVYDQAYWYSDQVDNTELGREMDFSRPFFEQFAELQAVVPRPALFTDFARDENSAYTNFAGRNKNCYLVFDSDENWDCYYSYSLNSSKNSLDCYRGEKLELCLEAVDSRRCYNCAFISNCENCSDSLFLNNCIGCKNCLFCSNLRQKEYCVMNDPVSKEQFEAMRKGLHSFAAFEEMRHSFRQFCRQFPQKSLRGFQNENVLGNYLTNCRNAYYCFDCRDGWDIGYSCQSFMPLKDSLDTNECGEGELLYECSNLGYSAFYVRFSNMCLSQLANMTYCELCFNGCHDLFGCVGLKKKQHCILNRQYRPEEYQQLERRLIGHMRDTGEWGENFPPSCSTTPYNLSMAQEYFPLIKEQAESLGYRWHDNEGGKNSAGDRRPPDSLRDTREMSLEQPFDCRSCGKPYKIIPQEVAYYKNSALPLPRECFFCRHKLRSNNRSPRKLWQQVCARCSAPFWAAYNPKDGGIIYCEQCYVAALE
jgi:hypothetical protein